MKTEVENTVYEGSIKGKRFKRLTTSFDGMKRASGATANIILFDENLKAAEGVIDAAGAKDLVRVGWKDKEEVFGLVARDGLELKEEPLRRANKVEVNGVRLIVRRAS